jgi:hypothetical protein
MVPEFDVAGEVLSAVIEANPETYVPFSMDMGVKGEFKPVVMMSLSHGRLVLGQELKSHPAYLLNSLKKKKNRKGEESSHAYIPNSKP